VTTKPPTWLADRLGAPTRRGVTAERCRDCRAQILFGWDDDVAATRVAVEPTPLTPMGEAIALLGGRSSYTLKSRKAGLALWRRDHWQIAGIKSPRIDIVATHKCGESLQLFQTASVFTIEGRVNYGERPPF
jgi:hypothetical protein